MDNLQKIKQFKKTKALQAPYRMFYLTSIAAILTIGGTTFFALHKKKIELDPQIKKIFAKNNTKLNIWQKIWDFLIEKTVGKIFEKK